PPPRRRRGEPNSEAQLSIFRAHEHHKNLSKLFPSLFRLFLALTPQNATAAPPRTPASSSRRRPAIPEQLRPRQPHQQLRLTLAHLPDHFSSTNSHRSSPADEPPPPPTALLRRSASSGPLLLRQGYPGV